MRRKLHFVRTIRMVAMGSVFVIFLRHITRCWRIALWSKICELLFATDSTFILLILPSLSLLIRCCTKLAVQDTPHEALSESSHQGKQYEKGRDALCTFLIHFDSISGTYS